MNEKTAELIKLIKENPDLPVVPMVNTGEIEDGRYWLMEFGSCELSTYTIYETYGESHVYFDDDVEDIENYLLDTIYEDGMTDEELSNLVQQHINALKWTKAIVVYISD